MPDLPTEVRHRAMLAAEGVSDECGYPLNTASRSALLAVVDAVAEVLADHWAPSAFAFLDLADVEVDRDALKARVAELSTQHLRLSHEVEALEEWNFWLSRTLRDMARRATSLRRLTDFAVTAPEPRGDRDALKARVAELEDANAELRAHGPIEVDGATYQCGWERAYMRHITVADGRTADAEARVDLLTTMLRRMARRATSFRSSYYRATRASTRYIMERSEARARVDLLTTALTEIVALAQTLDTQGLRHIARKALSATPTTPVPHTCQLPDIATVREPSRRWDCRVCDARWIAMGRIVGRRSRYEWHQMPVTKTATPTGCRFCGEPESDTVWCCDERMEADGPTEGEAP